MELPKLLLPQFLLCISYLLNIFFPISADSDEITFAEGEEITNIEMPDPGWWIGICRGKRGIFPKAYIELTETSPQEDLGKCGTAIYDYTAGK